MMEIQINIVDEMSGLTKECNYEDASSEMILKATALQAFGSLTKRMGESRIVLVKFSW